MITFTMLLELVQKFKKVTQKSMSNSSEILSGEHLYKVIAVMQTIYEVIAFTRCCRTLPNAHFILYAACPDNNNTLLAQGVKQIHTKAVACRRLSLKIQVPVSRFVVAGFMSLYLQVILLSPIEWTGIIQMMLFNVNVNQSCVIQ